MNHPKRIFLTVAFFAACFFNVADSSAQTISKLSEPSFDVVLQTIIASNNPTEKSDFPPSLSGIIKKLKSDFSFSDYRLTSTSMQRISNAGNFQFKGIDYETNQDKNLPAFSEWSLSGMQNALDDKGQETVQIQNFKFGQRIPIKNNGGTVTYEQIGLSTKFSLMKNTPTVVGSVTTAKPDELMFLILTVKSAEK